MLKKIFDPSRKLLKKGKIAAQRVVDLEPKYQAMTDEELKNQTQLFRERIKKGETLDDLLVEAFAVVREASKRVTGLVPYPVQIAGAYVIHGGNIAEMKTGEGKTLTAVMPAYLNALDGKGVHIVTVNEYLAKREAFGEIGDLFRFLGLTVGLNLREYSSDEKRAAYDCDVLYSTNSELGFDYLRDHMVLYKEQLVNQKGLNFAIIDEVDSILIDEARTPLIISGGQKDNQQLYEYADRFAKSLADEDFEIDLEDKTIELLPSGIEKAESMFNVENLYDISNVGLLHRINNALRGNYIMHRDVDYMVQNNEVLIVDQFTGRVLKGRQYSEGLHQALEAKEGVTIKEETVTVATITYQNFFRMYAKLSGMTGTAKTEEDEFRDIYNMLVVDVPTNAPIARKDEPDFMFKSLETKFEALIKEVEERHKKGQPILIGTIAVETSELISHMLYKRGIKHEVLNAKNHEREAEIVAKAGQLGAVTIATNMAGRGTDIKLGEGVVELGGLAVIGSERHEARRIDNQLRGRSGRQGDPGYSRFYISTEDDLMIRFAPNRFRDLIAKLHDAEGKPIESRILTKAVKSAQKKIEGFNYDSRKNVLKYDDVIRQHREIMYKERTAVLKEESMENYVKEIIEETLFNKTDKALKETKDLSSAAEKLYETLNDTFLPDAALNLDEMKAATSSEGLYEYVKKTAFAVLKAKRDSVPEEIFLEFLKIVMLRVIDTYWTEHIDIMDGLRQSVRLESYGQVNPLITYKKEGHALFDRLVENINDDITRYVMCARINYEQKREEVVENTSTNDGEEYTGKNKKRKQKGKKRSFIR